MDIKELKIRIECLSRTYVMLSSLENNFGRHSKHIAVREIDRYMTEVLDELKKLQTALTALTKLEKK